MALPIITEIGKSLRNTVSSTVKGLGGVGKSISGISKLGSNLSNESISSSSTKESTGVKKLKMNAERIKGNLIKSIKELKKQRLNKERIQRNILERKEIRDMEKNVTSTKTPIGKKVSSIVKSPMGIVDKIFGFGSILLTGIIVNAIDRIIQNWEEFRKNSIFTSIGKVIKSIGDFVDNNIDKIAKFEDGKLTGGALKYIVDTFKKIDEMARKVATVILTAAKEAPFKDGKFRWFGKQGLIYNDPAERRRIWRETGKDPGPFRPYVQESINEALEGGPLNWEQINKQFRNIDTSKLDLGNVDGSNTAIYVFNQPIETIMEIPSDSSKTTLTGSSSGGSQTSQDLFMNVG